MDALDFLMRARRPGGIRTAFAGIAIVAIALLGAGFLSDSPHPTETAPVGSPSVAPPRPGFVAAGLIDGNGGWAVTDRSLVASDDRGGTWKNMSPPGVAANEIRAVQFLDRYHGWVASSAATGRAGSRDVAIRIDSTADGGRSWSASRVTASVAMAASLDLVSLDFVNSQIGRLQVRLVSPGKDRFGLLFATTDGGGTWRRESTPTATRVEFTSADDGWTVDASGSPLFVTHDGARTWQKAAAVTLPADRAGWHATYDVPRFFGGLAGVLPVDAEESDAATAAVEGLFYRTTDGGATWTLAARTGAKHKSWGDVATFQPVSGPTRWLARSGAAIAMTVNAGDTWSGLSPSTSLATLGRYQLVGLDFAADDFGWAIAVPVDDGCWLESGFVCPASAGRLARTVDGGATWELLDPH